MRCQDLLSGEVFSTDARTEGEMMHKLPEERKMCKALKEKARSMEKRE